jgi:hypothetical protein
MKRKLTRWSFKQQRELFELAATSRSLETIADHLGYPPAILKKLAQLGLQSKTITLTSGVVKQVTKPSHAPIYDIWLKAKPR